MSESELSWIFEQDEDQEQYNVLAAYYRELASGPMQDYRHIIQGGNKQGQNYYTHVLDGIHVIHSLRLGAVIEMSDLEEELLSTSYTIHDLNKIPPYGGRNVTQSYHEIATLANIADALKRIEIARFFPAWESYLEDIQLLMWLHQHDAAPLADLDLRKHAYKHPYKRLVQLGKLLYATDNLNLSHTLSERKHKQNFLATVNALAPKRWRWITHHLGENRAVFSNLIHNTTVAYLQNRHTHDTHPLMLDLLYYPDGTAYLLPEREPFHWSEDDNRNVSQALARLIETKQSMNLSQFIKANQQGIRVSQAAIESGASYTDILAVIRERVERKTYLQKWHSEYNQRLRPDIEKASRHADQLVVACSAALLSQTTPIVPHDQNLLKRGDLALAYYNLLNDHLKEALKKTHQCDPWPHVYRQFQLPPEKDELYNQINAYRRAYFIACDSQESLDTLFERIQLDIAVLTGEEVEKAEEDNTFYDYLSENLKLQGSDAARDFTAHLRYYCKAKYKQCCMCSSTSPTGKLMGPEVPINMGVQVFSNRLRGGSGEPKRNVCPTCRTQLILEKLTRVSFKKGNDQYTNFYVHFYPYAFFTRAYQNTVYLTLKNLVHEETPCFLLKSEGYFRAWDTQFSQALTVQMTRQAQEVEEHETPSFPTSPTKVNGISVPPFSEAIANTPTFPINAPGENYSQQFLFALTQALMLADFFGCRVALSRTPFPLLTNDYMSEHELAFFVDGVPLNLRWLLPTNEYRSLETYRDGQARDGGALYLARQAQWPHEQPDAQGYAAYEHISRRLNLLYTLAQRLNLLAEKGQEFFLEIAMALADDPLAIYYVVDLAIEKQVRETRQKPGRDKGQSHLRGTKGGSGRQMAPEQMAIMLSKRVTPLLAILGRKTAVEPLKQMATLAAEEHLKGRSFKRNSILKPLDIILENLEREPRPDMRDAIRHASERDIFDHIDRITEAQYRPGFVKREHRMDQIRVYVDLFFDDLLEKMHGGDVNRLLQRSKVFRSAYLSYYRDALPNRTRDQADVEQTEEAQQNLLTSDN